MSGFDRRGAVASEPLRRFLQVARGAGLRVSAAEGIDAARAVDMVVGFEDRTVLKDTLGLILAKTPDEKELSTRRSNFISSVTSSPARTKSRDHATPQAPVSAARRLRRRRHGRLRRPVAGADAAGGDDRAALAAAMEKAAREAGVENIRFFTQKNLYARRILDRMGLRGLERDMEAMRRDRRSGHSRVVLEGKVEQLRDAVRDFVERNLLLYARGETEKFREELLKSARLSQPRAARSGPDARAGAADGEEDSPRATRRRGGGGCAGNWTRGARCGGTWAGAAFRSSPSGNRSVSRSRA